METCVLVCQLMNAHRDHRNLRCIGNHVDIARVET